MSDSEHTVQVSTPDARLEGGAIDPAPVEGAQHEGGGAGLSRVEPSADSVGERIAENLSLGQPLSSPHDATPANPPQLLDAARVSFQFPMPAFSNPVQAEIKRIETNSSIVADASLSQPTASKDSQLGGSHSTGGGVGIPSIPFSALSASALANAIGGKIQSFKPDLWTAEDVSGAAFLEVVSPPQLLEFLEHTMFINSSFTRTRVANFIRAMIEADGLLLAAVKKSWAVSALPEPAPVQAASATAGQFLSPAPPVKLFQTPSLDSTKEQTASSFLSEIKGRVGFDLDDSALFQSDSNKIRATVTDAQTPSYSVASHASAQGGAPRFEVVINQASAEKPKYIVLENTDNAEEMAKWLRRNREETLLALPVDRRPLAHLLSKDCKEEVSRVIVAAKIDDPKLFCEGALYPATGWPGVTDKLLLRVLFKKNGPPSADAAKEHLKKIRFFFNDSTTHQKLFTAKLRKHCKRFTGELHDFDYVCRLWPEHDKVLSHAMIIDSFAEGFSDTSTVLGPDNTTQVAKCSNLAKIREFIRQRKACVLEDIICEAIRWFERLDSTIRSNSKVSYDVTPWRTEAETGKKKNKRKFNQIAGGGESGEAAMNSVVTPSPDKKPRPTAIHPRCNNCGSKGHKCGERTCFLFGHPKGKGLQGEWPEGTPSLRLDVDDYKQWSVKRKPIFYAYPENQGKKGGI